MELNYNDAAVARLSAVKVLDWDGAKTLGEELGKSAGSIVAKFKSIGLGEYKAKERKEAVGVVLKKVYVKEVQALLGVTVVTLDKVTKNDLIKIRDALVDLNGPLEVSE